jgi:hypothetical protein
MFRNIPKNINIMEIFVNMAYFLNMEIKSAGLAVLVSLLFVVHLRAGDDRLGICTGFGRTTQTRDPVIMMPLIAGTGAGWIRDGLNVGDIDPTFGGNPSTFNFPAQDYNWISLAGQYDLKVCLLLDHCKGPSEMATVCGWVASYVATHPDLSAVKAIEVLNEPDGAMQPYYGGSRYYAAPIPPWEEQYRQMLNQTAKAVKAANPSLQVIGCGASMPSSYCEIQAGLDPSVDGITDHPYPNKNGQGVQIEFVGYDATTIGRDGIATTDAAGSFSSEVDMLRSWILKYGPAKQLWHTEWGVTTVTDRAGQWQNTQADQGVWYMRRLTESLAKGVEHTFIYILSDEARNPLTSYDNYGLLTTDLDKKVSYYYVGRVIRVLAGLSPSRYFPAVNSPPTETYRAYGFDSPEGSRSVVAYWTGGWSSDNGVLQPVTITFHHPGTRRVRLYDPISNTNVGTKWVQSGRDVVVSGPSVSIGSVPQFIIFD